MEESLASEGWEEGEENEEGKLRNSRGEKGGGEGGVVREQSHGQVGQRWRREERDRGRGTGESGSRGGWGREEEKKGFV